MSGYTFSVSYFLRQLHIRLLMGAWGRVYNLLDPLHFGYFGERWGFVAGYAVEVLGFLTGLAPGVLAITGGVMWLVRRRRRRAVGDAVQHGVAQLNRAQRGQRTAQAGQRHATRGPESPNIHGLDLAQPRPSMRCVGWLATQYDRYGGKSYSLALHILKDGAAAEDVVVAAFLALRHAAADHPYDLKDQVLRFTRDLAVQRLQRPPAQ